MQIKDQKAIEAVIELRINIKSYYSAINLQVFLKELVTCTTWFNSGNDLFNFINIILRCIV